MNNSSVKLKLDIDDLEDDTMDSILESLKHLKHTVKTIRNAFTSDEIKQLMMTLKKRTIFQIKSECHVRDYNARAENLIIWWKEELSDMLDLVEPDDFVAALDEFYHKVNRQIDRLCERLLESGYTRAWELADELEFLNLRLIAEMAIDFDFLFKCAVERNASYTEKGDI